VRGSRDRERLLALGVPPDRGTAAADMAWPIPPAATEFGRRILQQHGLTGHRLVGVNVNAESALLEAEPALFEKLAAVLDRLVDSHGVRVVFLCNEIREGETYDKAAAAMVLSHMRRKDAATALPNEYWTPQEMMSIIAACGLTISTRYHFCLFSALQGVPFLAIKRSDKVVDLCEDIGWEFGAVPGSVDVEDLTRQATALLAEPAHALGRLSDQVRVMAERERRNEVALDAMLACVGATSRLHSLRAALLRRVPVA
jgi:polysaccharide pyruvyl transferase WcaK-like protein